MIPYRNNIRRLYEHRLRRPVSVVLIFVFLPVMLAACSMGEEMRRIEEARQKGLARAASRTSNLSGEQIFVRSCNTCHPKGREGMGPRLDNTDNHFSSDDSLKKFLRKGHGIMPAQPPAFINDEELNNLVLYLRVLAGELKESK